MDEVSQAILVNRSALAMLAIPQVEARRIFLSRLRDDVIADLRARRLDRDLATVRADLVIESVLDAMACGVPRLRTVLDGLERNIGPGPTDTDGEAAAGASRDGRSPVPLNCGGFRAGSAERA